MRGAECWTDHFMVRAKLVLDFKPVRSSTSSWKPFAVHLLRDRETLLEFEREMEVSCAHPAEDASDIEGEWRSLKADITSVSSTVLGYGRRKQPDWFLENRSALEPLVAAQSHARDRMLSQDTRAFSSLCLALLS